MVIGILIDAGVRHLLGLISPGVIDVGNRYPFNVAGLVSPGHQILPALARADDAEPNAVIRPPNAQGRSRGGRADHKSPSRNIICHFDTPPLSNIRLSGYRAGTMTDPCTLRTWAWRERGRGQNACRAEFLPIHRQVCAFRMSKRFGRACSGPVGFSTLPVRRRKSITSLLRRLRTSFLLLGRAKVYTSLYPR